MKEMLNFSNPQFGEIRTAIINQEPWFVAVDICAALDVSNATVAVGRLEEDERAKLNLGRQGETTIINEPGLYSLVLGSRKPEAKAFKRWITHEVIPSIRRNGAYMTPDTIEKVLLDPDTIIGLATRLKEEQERTRLLSEQNAVQRQQIAELQPKASYYDICLNCSDLIPISTIAKDYGKSAVAMNALLHELGIQYRHGDTWLLYQKYAQGGYTSTKTHVVYDYRGDPHTKVSTCWTQRGRLFLYDLLKQNGILPAIEAEAAVSCGEL
jgi:prophage antirepressor-like protein